MQPPPRECAGRPGGRAQSRSPPNRRKRIPHLSPSGKGLLAPGADFGLWRKTIGPTERVRPVSLRQFGDLIHMLPDPDLYSSLGQLTLSVRFQTNSCDDCFGETKHEVDVAQGHESPYPPFQHDPEHKDDSACKTGPVSPGMLLEQHQCCQ